MTMASTVNSKVKVTAQQHQRLSELQERFLIEIPYLKEEQLKKHMKKRSLKDNKLREFQTQENHGLLYEVQERFLM